MKITHLSENGRTNEETVNVEKALAEGDCSKDMALKWGDIVEVAEMDHKVSEVYMGLTEPIKATLSKCLAREVEIVVKGEMTKVKLIPDLSDARTGGHVKVNLFSRSRPGYIVEKPSFWLDNVVHSANVILASSDLTRVKVKRVERGSGKMKEMVFNLEKMEPNSDLWLEDGDVIEIPER